MDAEPVRARALCRDCRLVQPATPRCVVCDAETFSLDARPPAIFRPVEEVRLARRPEPSGWRKVILALATVAVLPIASIGGGALIRVLPMRYADELLAWILGAVFFGPLTVIGLLGYVRRRRRTIGVRIAPLSRLPAQLHPTGTPLLRGAAHALGSAGSVILTVRRASPRAATSQTLLRSATTTEFLIHGANGETIQITGAIHLVTDGESGDPCDVAASTEWAVGDALGDAVTRVHQIDDGQVVEVWGKAQVEQRSDGYRDAPVPVARGVQGRPLLIRRAAS